MGYAGLDAVGADATRALPVFRPAGRDKARSAAGYAGPADGRHAGGHDVRRASAPEVRYADSGRFPDRSWQQDLGGQLPRESASVRLVVDWYDRYGRFPDDVPGSGY
jgi:hypothetical protein